MVVLKKIWEWIKGLFILKPKYVVKYPEITVSQKELEILKRINFYRNQNGLSLLTYNRAVHSFCFEHSLFMADEGNITHNGYHERFRALYSIEKATTYAENVGAGYLTAESLINAWLNSEEHRDKLFEKEVTHFAVSQVRANNNRFYYTYIAIKK